MCRLSAELESGTAHQNMNGIASGTVPFHGAMVPSIAWRGCGMDTEPWATAIGRKASRTAETAEIMCTVSGHKAVLPGSIRNGRNYHESKLQELQRYSYYNEQLTTPHEKFSIVQYWRWLAAVTGQVCVRPDE